MLFKRHIPWKTHLDRRYYNIFSPETIFTDDNKRKTVEKFAKMRPINPKTVLPTKSAAVLIPICVVDDKVSLLYTLRSPNLKAHRGQVSFPGGMQDISDQDSEETALRETHEELGIKPDQVEVWGRGNVIVSRGVTGVLPVIGRLTSHNVMHDIKINPLEVKEVFAVPLEDLCDPGKIGHTQFKNDYSLPVYLGGKRRIWGLTALITHLFLNAFLPRRAYSNNIKYLPQVKGGLPYRLL